MMLKTRFTLPAAVLLLMSALPAAAQMQHHYKVTITNLTNNQPLSPVAGMAHGHGYHPYRIGEAATKGLEHLAEDGNPQIIVNEARANTAVYASTTTAAPIPPGGNDSFMVSVNAPASGDHALYLSALTMLVNTNDAFTGFTGHDVSYLMVGESESFTIGTYDAGTEANSETAATIPGPAGGGEGYNATRDDLADQVTGHIGVLTIDEGLANSALDQSHRFLNPTAKVTITRMDDTVISTALAFTGIQSQYIPGDELNVKVSEVTAIRQEPADLWVAIQFPDNNIAYVDETGALSALPVPFKQAVSTEMKEHDVLTVTIPEGIGGRYTFFAAFAHRSAEQNTLESDIAHYSTWVSNN